MTPRLTPDLGAIRFLDPRDAGGVLNATFAFLRATVRPLRRTSGRPPTVEWRTIGTMSSPWPPRVQALMPRTTSGMGNAAT